jgi:hypothetical protein
VVPDDYFRKGVFGMARFGKHVVMRNNMTNRDGITPLLPGVWQPAVF